MSKKISKENRKRRELVRRREAEFLECAESSPFTFEISDKRDSIEVPQAADGSLFTPDLIRWDGTYQIGPQYAEKIVDGYWMALRLMHHMSAPSWRRPGRRSKKKTDPSIVKAVRWVTINKDGSFGRAYRLHEEPLPGGWGN